MLAGSKQVLLRVGTYRHKRDAAENTEGHGEKSTAKERDQEDLFARVQPRLVNNLASGVSAW
jgi:hypothetical protein